MHVHDYQHDHEHDYQHDHQHESNVCEMRLKKKLLRRPLLEDAFLKPSRNAGFKGVVRSKTHDALEGTFPCLNIAVIISFILLVMIMVGGGMFIFGH